MYHALERSSALRALLQLTMCHKECHELYDYKADANVDLHGCVLDNGPRRYMVA